MHTNQDRTLTVEGLKKHFRRRGLFRTPPPVRAVDGISFTVPSGGMQGIVGESGCGKSTAAKLILGLLPATAGGVSFGDTPVSARINADWRRMRRRMQMIYQDPLGALDRRFTAARQIAEPLVIHEPTMTQADRDAAVADVMQQVGLSRHHGSRYPHELSGGQRQRAVIARALILSPDLLVCDEPVSALDVSVQAQVLNLFEDLRERSGFTSVFISHDLKVVRQIVDQVAVMYLGRIVESGAPDDVFHAPAHPYTKALVSAVPTPGRKGRKRILLDGDPPNPAAVPAGCPFHPRCPEVLDICRTQTPSLLPSGGRSVACHRVNEPVAARDPGQPQKVAAA